MGPGIFPETSSRWYTVGGESNATGKSEYSDSQICRSRDRVGSQSDMLRFASETVEKH